MPNLSAKDRPRSLAYAKLTEARSKLQAKASDLVEAYMTTIQASIKKGDYEVALKAIQWALVHMPEEDGLRVIENPVDKIKTEGGGGGPSITIGVALGGVTTRVPELAPPEESMEPRLQVIDLGVVKEDG